ncbi:MAG TPA: hypothetical protein VGH33_16935 [Isosphaeraceae bacterium]|jgi:hypothetical protein
MDENEGESPLGDVETELKELLGLFDAPAFARRGMDLEHALARLDARCRRERDAMLEMVRLRLKQWAGVASGPETAEDVFTRRIDGLWPLADAPPPVWCDRPAPARKLRSAARELVASVERFNGRWGRFLDGLNYEPINGLIERYNRYYLLEKECTLRSARLAARHFEPKPRVTGETLRERHPTLPVPELKS